MPNSRFPFQQSHTSLTHPSLPTEWHVSFITRALPGSAGGARGELPSRHGCLLPLAQPGYGAALAGERDGRAGGEGERLCWGGLAEWLKRLCSFILSDKSPCSTPWRFSPPVFFLSLFFLYFPFFFFLSLAVGTNWVTRIIQAAPACWGLCKWIWELLVSHDSNVHYWRWMFLKKRLMMDIRLIVPFIILNII